MSGDIPMIHGYEERHGDEPVAREPGDVRQVIERIANWPDAEMFTSLAPAHAMRALAREALASLTAQPDAESPVRPHEAYSGAQGEVMTIPLDSLVEAYKTTGSVYAVGRQFGIHGSSVHERLTKVPGLVKGPKRWSPDALTILETEYTTHANAGTLAVLAKRLGVGKTSVCAKAATLGLTDQKRKKPYISVWAYMSEDEAAEIWDHFKRNSLGLVAYCKRKGYDDLGFSRTMKSFFGDEWESVMESKQPRTSLYRHGRRFEYMVRNKLREAGFFAQRSPASKSVMDILAVRPGEVWMVQCKRGGALGVAEWNALFDTAREYGAIPILASQEAGRGSMAFFVLVERKDGSKRPQPMSRVYPLK
jgi:Holliday junction resolvase